MDLANCSSRAQNVLGIRGPARRGGMVADRSVRHPGRFRDHVRLPKQSPVAAGWDRFPTGKMPVPPGTEAGCPSGGGRRSPAGPQRFPASCQWSISYAPFGACAFGRPFRADVSRSSWFPGRCPGLYSVAPSGLADGIRLVGPFSHQMYPVAPSGLADGIRLVGPFSHQMYSVALSGLTDTIRLVSPLSQQMYSVALSGLRHG